MAPGEQKKKKKRRRSKAIAVLLVLFLLWFTYTQVSSGLAFLVIIILVPSLAAFFILRRRRRSRAKRVLFEMGVQNLDQMDGIAFEHFLEALFTRLGYESEATQASGDYGVDVLLHKNGKRIAVQAKHYSSPVGLSAVQEAHTGTKYYEADEAWVITNNGFTKAARELADKTGVRLITGPELRQIVASASRKRAPKKPDREPPPPP
ncbi:MAG: restriction endonuclease [Thaumarchaeota archaeon]|nr:restriction endonuclease [Nitrososphaerota archaeon]